MNDLLSLEAASIRASQLTREPASGPQVVIAQEDPGRIQFPKTVRSLPVDANRLSGASDAEALFHSYFSDRKAPLGDEALASHFGGHYHRPVIVWHFTDRMGLPAARRAAELIREGEDAVHILTTTKPSETTQMFADWILGVTWSEGVVPRTIDEFLYPFDGSRGDGGSARGYELG